jgi:Zn-dependent peptidase ImmA (M78 family)/DNA-binding XRE family transcriptional regulator
MPINETARTVAEAIKTGRQQLGWSQTDLAEQVGRTQTAVSYWEAGKRTPGLEDLVDLSKALQKDIAFFLPNGGERQPIRAILRATAAQLDLGELDSALQGFLDQVEAMAPPIKTVEISARRPALAAQELVKGSGASEPPIDVKALAEECGVLVLPYKFDDDLSGLVVELDGGAAIGVNEDQARVRQRFTIAHELGHYLMGHHERFHIDLGRGESDGTPPGYDWMSERAANDFAADLLMPAWMIQRLDNGARSASELADLFDVSGLAMGYRLANLGLR